MLRFAGSSWSLIIEPTGEVVPLGVHTEHLDYIAEQSGFDWYGEEDPDWCELQSDYHVRGGAELRYTGHTLQGPQLIVRYDSKNEAGLTLRKIVDVILKQPDINRQTDIWISDDSKGEYAMTVEELFDA